MTKKPGLEDDDINLFRAAMRDVKPLPSSNKILSQHPLPTFRKKRQQITETINTAPFSDYEKESPLSSDDLVEFSRPGIQHKILRKMRLGQYNVDAILDLHGMHVDEAKEALYRFLLQCLKQGVTHTLVIHGKGRSNMNQPVLKNKLNNWLRQMDYVLAFSSATGRDGRSGAMYVLLKNQKGRKSFE